jgi:hypothetical protein
MSQTNWVIPTLRPFRDRVGYPEQGRDPNITDPFINVRSQPESWGLSRIVDGRPQRAMIDEKIYYMKPTWEQQWPGKDEKKFTPTRREVHLSRPQRARAVSVQGPTVGDISIRHRQPGNTIAVIVRLIANIFGWSAGHQFSSSGRSRTTAEEGDNLLRSYWLDSFQVIWMKFKLSISRDLSLCIDFGKVIIGRLLWDCWPRSFEFSTDFLEMTLNIQVVCLAKSLSVPVSPA